MYYDSIFSLNIWKIAAGIFVKKIDEQDKQEEIKNLEEVWRKERQQDDVITENAKQFRKNLADILVIITSLKIDENTKNYLISDKNANQIKEILNNTLDKLIPEAKEE